MEISYITTRILESPNGKGKIRIIVPKGSSTAMVEFLCPNCGEKWKGEKEWKIPFTMECEHCDFKVKIRRLRSEIKKKRK